MTYSPDLIADVPEKYVELLPGDRIVHLPSLQGELSGSAETLEARTAMGALSGLIFAARQADGATALAHSWRNFRVGATAIMVNFDTGGYGYLTGYNVKPQSSGGLNLHAEQIALAKGRQLELKRLIGIAVLADPECTDANPLGLSTLRPCGRCIDMFAKAPEVDERTLILGMNPDLSVCELYSFSTLVDTPRPAHAIAVPPFSLKTDDDLEHYDHSVQPRLMGAILEMYGTPLVAA